MQAAWYEKQGPPGESLVVGEMAEPTPGAGELRIRIAASGVNPGDVKKRQDTFGVGMPYPRVVPHSDGAGTVDQVGDGVDAQWVGKRVWCFGAQSYRPFGTAAELCVVPESQVSELPADASFEQGALLGIPGLTAHRAIHAGGPVDGRTVLVQGGAGAVGTYAVRLARLAGATVIATVQKAGQSDTAKEAGAHHVVQSGERLLEEVTALAPDGVDHIVEVAFAANIGIDERMLKLGGSIAAYASNAPEATIPFWPLVFKNVRVFFLGSDDFPIEAKRQAAHDLSAAIEHAWVGLPIGARFGLADIADAHAYIEERRGPGRVIVVL
ncbi:MAG: NADPH:quinone reductase [Rhodothermales bacterium]|nr:NADPH:quinone reductase [Rhodothermales bacterium]